MTTMLIEGVTGGLVLAGVPLEGLIYLVVLVFWVIAQVKQAKRRRQRSEAEGEPTGAPPTPSPSQMPPIDQEIRELFETITGQKLETPPRAPPPPVAPPLPSARPGVPARPGPTARPSQRPHRRHRPAPQPPALPTPPVPLSRPLAAVPALPQGEEDAYDLQAVTASLSPGMAQASLATGGMSSGMRSTNLPAMRSTLSSGREPGAPSPLLRLLRTRDGQRAAMVQRVVLGPPRALEPL